LVPGYPRVGKVLNFSISIKYWYDLNCTPLSGRSLSGVEGGRGAKIKKDCLSFVKGLINRIALKE